MLAYRTEAFCQVLAGARNVVGLISVPDVNRTSGQALRSSVNSWLGDRPPIAATIRLTDSVAGSDVLELATSLGDCCVGADPPEAYAANGFARCGLGGTVCPDGARVDDTVLEARVDDAVLGERVRGAVSGRSTSMGVCPVDGRAGDR